jgi:hypothetical protein
MPLLFFREWYANESVLLLRQLDGSFWSLKHYSSAKGFDLLFRSADISLPHRVDDIVVKYFGVAVWMELKKT